MSVIVEPREVKLSTRTETIVRRLLPHAKLRRIGAWVFLDHFGPTPQVHGMQVQRHPHTALQTVTWLFDGRVEHRDSIGSVQVIEPGQLNLMTAGRGVAHSEQSVITSEQSIAGANSQHAVQLWLALPEAVKDMAPMFEHHDRLPELRLDAITAKVFIGALAGIESPARVFSPLVGAELVVRGRSWLPLRPGWQHGLLVVDGKLKVEAPANTPVAVDLNELVYLEPQPNPPAPTPNAPGSAVGFGVWLEPAEGASARVILIGGEPFDEEIIMWWNFIARTPEELQAVRAEWNEAKTGEASDRFPFFDDGLGGWIPAPELPNVTLRPRGSN